jgi:hypothetical protein
VQERLKPGYQRRAGDGICVVLFSSGWKASRPWRWHSGRSSRKRLPWCASHMSPGAGICPPRSTLQPRWCDGGATQAGRHQPRAVAREACDTMDACRLNGFGQGHGRQDGGESPCQHRRPFYAGSSYQIVVISIVYPNFCLPHASLRQPLPQPVPTNGTGSAKMWQPHTPAMAAGLTHHVWSLREVLRFRVPPWPQSQAL